MMHDIKISKEQARLLWTIINSGQVYGCDRLAKHIEFLGKYSALKASLSKMTTETGREYMALQAFKEDLVRILENNE
jgi:hypothetical protein